MLKPAIIIVPGALHRPEHYQGIVSRLHKLQYEAVAVSMPSLSSSPPQPTWTEDVEAIRKAIFKFSESGQDVVLVGHSYSGILISEASKGLSRKDLPHGEGAVVRLIYMCAIAVPVGESLTGQLEPRTPQEVEAFREEGSISLLDADKVRDVLYNKCEPKVADWAISLLGKQPVTTMSTPATHAAWLEIPSTYLICEDDLAVPECVQLRMAKQGNGAFDIVRCQEGHAPCLSNPDLVVRMIRNAAGEAIEI
ncbi:alpha/beta hydrolase [Aspergillus novofumigatus IBT 16806]|uniref:Alpha/beta hydrolase nvfD n=1 Tax=Aspergillus novofumigatus (strain IBT 16806) TaxID=1392255 RepID=NVFD_ASPN1|nr:alpha/beta-hydrolase [Aspergillus novofumigatus IBT 16806]A0A2I1BT15.1 RecName: Full=Alpha/beta hydrolase nvfD; AltName: Full=Novofumigatonin biosynthesis cluster protein D [Aspergillus novofumigatus IBT 16806]PKX88484.1 alpha/beta-hydrolase [Aspergillus novofumigatus IBT 16806]